MKKRIIAAGTAALSLTVAAPAGAHTHAQLHSRLGSLQQQINVLKNRTASMRRQLSCIQFVVPLTSYGNEGGGYVFDNNEGAGAFFTSAIDFTESGEVPDAWVVAVDPSCAPETAKAQVLRTDRRGRAGAAPLVPRPTHKTRGE